MDDSDLDTIVLVKDETFNNNDDDEFYLAKYETFDSDDDRKYFSDGAAGSYSEDEKPKPKPKTKKAAARGTHCCNRFCVNMFDEEFRSQLTFAMSKLTKSEKRVYLFGMISIDEDKQNCSELRRTSSKYFQYSVRVRGVVSYVCKRAFMILYDTTNGALRTLCTKMMKKCLIPIDERGKQNENIHCIARATKELIEAHFYAVLESPTIFKCVKGKLDDGEPNMKKLWMDFVQRYGEIGHKVSRLTYTKYVQSFLTPDVLSKFKAALFAYRLTQKCQNKEILQLKFEV